MISDAILKADGLGKTYRSGDRDLTVLMAVSFEIGLRETCAIVGPSGSGKTTLLGLCAGLDQPSEGEVWLDGKSLGGLDEDDRAMVRNQSVGFVFQNFQLLGSLTSLENVMVPLELRGEEAIRDRAIELLERVGLGDRVHHYPSQLSGGEQQRVALARAFVNQPKILFADEPTGNLDGETSAKVIQLMFSLNAELGTSLVLVTHDLDVSRRAGRVLRLRNGEVVDDTGAAEKT